MKNRQSKKALGEVDYPDHTRVYLPTSKGGYEQVWVKVSGGTKFKGRGIIDCEPKHAFAGRSKFKLGDEIEYAGGNGKILPKFVKRFSNKLDTLKADIAIEMANAMRFNPGH